MVWMMVAWDGASLLWCIVADEAPVRETGEKDWDSASPTGYQSP